MDDRTEKLRTGKGLYAGHLRAKRKTEQVEYLRNFAAVKDLLAPIEAKESEQKRKLYDAIREVAVPVLDEFLRDRPAPKGRPRKDALADEAAQLKKSGLSYAQISRRLNQEHGDGTATKESVRKLVNSRKHKTAHGTVPPDVTKMRKPLNS